MLTENQKKFLDFLPPEKSNRIVRVEPWDPRGLMLASQIVEDIQKAVPDLEILLGGSVPLKIAGEKDIDITVYCPKSEQAKYTPHLARLLGPHTSEGQSHTGWAFEKDGYNATVYLSDPRSPNTIEQKQVHLLLASRPDLAREYEQVKLAMNGKTYKEYQSAKYDFFNRILGIQ